jgi:hypothetical protein
MSHRLSILEAENAELGKANELATKRKERKRKRLQQKEPLTVQEALDLINQSAVDDQISRETQHNRSRLKGDAPRRRRCGNCNKIGNYILTCHKRELDEIEVIS